MSNAENTVVGPADHAPFPAAAPGGASFTPLPSSVDSFLAESNEGFDSSEKMMIGRFEDAEKL
jgi:hypothetical protein